jgi:galactose-1-phosphate uridylyltransferase
VRRARSSAVQSHAAHRADARRQAGLLGDFRWHIEILPRLHHLGGLELATACWVNSVWPETAADYLRGLQASEL